MRESQRNYYTSIVGDGSKRQLIPLPASDVQEARKSAVELLRQIRYKMRKLGKQFDDSNSGLIIGVSDNMDAAFREAYARGKQATEDFINEHLNNGVAVEKLIL